MEKVYSMNYCHQIVDFHTLEGRNAEGGDVDHGCQARTHFTTYVYKVPSHSCISPDEEKCYSFPNKALHHSLLSS